MNLKRGGRLENGIPYPQNTSMKPTPPVTELKIVILLYPTPESGHDSKVLHTAEWQDVPGTPGQPKLTVAPLADCAAHTPAGVVHTS